MKLLSVQVYEGLWMNVFFNTKKKTKKKKNQSQSNITNYSAASTSGSLREREMLWEHEPTGEHFPSFFEFSHTFIRVSMTFFLLFLENTVTKK